MNIEHILRGQLRYSIGIESVIGKQSFVLLKSRMLQIVPHSVLVMVFDRLFCWCGYEGKTTKNQNIMQNNVQRPPICITNNLLVVEKATMVIRC